MSRHSQHVSWMHLLFRTHRHNFSSSFSFYLCVWLVWLKECYATCITQNTMLQICSYSPDPNGLITSKGIKGKNLTFLVVFDLRYDEKPTRYTKGSGKCASFALAVITASTFLLKRTHECTSFHIYLFKTFNAFCHLVIVRSRWNPFTVIQ